MQVARLEHRRCWLTPVSCTIKALGAGQVPARAVPAREQRAAMCKHGRGTTFAPCSQLAHATPCVDYWVEADRIGQVIAVAAIARAINTWPLASSVSVCTSRGRGRLAAFRTPMLQGRSASTRKPPMGAIAAACQFVAGEPGCDADRFFYDALLAALLRAYEAFSGNQGVFSVAASACTTHKLELQAAHQKRAVFGSWHERSISWRST